MNLDVKFTEAQVTDIRARVKALDFGAIEKIKKAKDDNGTFDVIISTEDLDRSGEIVRQNGWEMTNYKNNPIVLWGHDYYSLPIGVCLETYQTEYHGVPATGAKGVFLSADINPLAQQVRKLYEFGLKHGEGVGCTTSVGFIPKEFDESNQRVITRAELLEFSFVPVPANQGVGPARGRSITIDEAKALGLDMYGLERKGVEFAEIRGFIPKDNQEKKAPENTTWTAPTLKDFTEKSWDQLNAAEKAEISAHFAYSTDIVPKTFEDLKLPYRQATDGVIVLNGLKAAISALPGAIEENSDRKAVYDHLASLYKLFNKEAPDFKTLKEAQAGDSCTMDDGTPGVLTTDKDGAMVCMPTEDKSAKGDHTSQRTLLKAVGDEHERHAGEIEKCFDAFQKSVAEDQGDPVDANEGKSLDGMREHLKDLRSSVTDEYTMHRAKSVAAMRGFDPAEDKAFDKKPHLKALREEHDAYETKCGKALDDFEEKCMKSVKTVQGETDETDGHVEWITGKMEENGNVHKKAVVKIAKAMCKAAFGEEDQADEKTIEVLKEYLSPHVDSLILNALVAKIGAKISGEFRKKLGEAHEHMKAANAVVEALHGAFEDSDGEESRSPADVTPAKTVPGSQRSRPAKDASAKEELDAHLLARDVLRGVTTAASAALERLKDEGRSRRGK